MMLRSRARVKSQKINLHQLLQNLEKARLPLIRLDKTIRKTSGIEAIIIKLTSEIRAHDKELEDFYNNHGKQQIARERLFSKNNQLSTTESIDTTLVDEYAEMHALITRWFLEAGYMLVAQAAELQVKYKDTNLNELLQILK